jgi:hypothetical protein
VKTLYGEYVQALQKLTLDVVDHTKDVTLKNAYDLLLDKSEQENHLMSLIINKLVHTHTKGVHQLLQA